MSRRQVWDWRAVRAPITIGGYDSVTGLGLESGGRLGLRCSGKDILRRMMMV